jgi:hypothetical protein
MPDNDNQPPPPPPPPVRRWVTYFVAFGVSVAVGLAPLLGVLKIPLFSSLLDLIPDFQRHSLIPVVSALMGLVAVLVQWYSEEKLSRARRRRALLPTVFLAMIAAVSFYVVTTYVVVNIDFGGSDHRETGTFLVGFHRPNDAPCQGVKSDAVCIERLTFDQNVITAFWGQDSIRTATLALSAPYLIFMLSFGAAVGIVMHGKGEDQNENESSRPRAAALASATNVMPLQEDSSGSTEPQPAEPS